MRFWSLFVLPCLAVLVPGGAFSTLLSAAEAAAAAAATAAAAVYSVSHQFPQVFSSSRVPEVTLGTFAVDSGACSSFRAFLFWCREQQQQQRHQPPSISHQFLTVLVPGGAFGTLLSAAATAAATAPAA